MKKIFTTCLLAGMAGLFLAACSEEEDNYTPEAPEVEISLAGGSTNCVPGTSFTFSVVPDTTTARLTWSVNRSEAGEGSEFSFIATELGVQEILLTAEKEGGIGTDTLYINVHEPEAGPILTQNDIVNWTGETGSNRSILAIQWVTANETDLLNPAEENIRFLAWGYRWNEGTERTCMDMIKAIAANDPRLFVIINDEYGAIGGFIYDADNDGAIRIHNDAMNLTQDDFENGVYYVTNTADCDDITIDGNDLWMGGYMNTYATYYLENGQDMVPTKIGISNDLPGDRLLMSDSWDVWTLTPNNANWRYTEPRMELIVAAE